MTIFNRRRREELRKSFLHKKGYATIKKTIRKAFDRLRQQPFYSDYNDKMMPVNLDHSTMSWMKAHTESMLTGRGGSVTWMDLANAWLGRNELMNLFAGDSMDKRYSLVGALNRLQASPGAASKAISNWDEALEFIQLEMNVPQEKIPLQDDFIKQMEVIKIDNDVSLKRSKSFWKTIASRKPFSVLIKDDEDALLEEQIAHYGQYGQDEDDEESQSFAIAPLSKEDQDHIFSVMHGGVEEDIVAQIGGDSVQRRSFATLMPGQWLNDEVIHAYLQLLSCDGHHFFKSFFVTKLRNENVPGRDGQYQYSNVKRWSKKVKGAFP